MSRTSTYAVPDSPRICTLGKPCVYRELRVCPAPRVCKGNSDAACHRINNKDLIGELHQLDSGA